MSSPSTPRSSAWAGRATSPADEGPFDLAVVGGHLLDPAAGLDGPGDIAVRGGRIAAVGPPGRPLPAARVLDATGLLVTPGLVDLHAHVYEGVSHYGVDADAYCLGRGVTTALDVGSAGARTFGGLRRLVINRARTRVLALLNLAVQGMITPAVGELEDLRWASPSELVARAREHADVVVGAKVRLGYQMVGPDPRPALALAREAADGLDAPLMVHVIDMLMPITELLGHLGPGDVVTHCFHGNDGGILDERGRVFAAVREAARRGVVFDVGHGIGSFAWRVARAALAQGFAPTTISSDVHAHNVDGPAFDLPTTMSKLLHLGLPLADVVAAATSRAAAALGRGEHLGALAEGREADVTLLEAREGAWRLTDGERRTQEAGRLLVARHVVRAGVVHALDSPVPERVGRASRRASRGPT